jgi:tetratricopeptide (TPR) repeat protein
MTRNLAIVACCVMLAVASATAYQAAARDRDYRALLGRGDAALHEEQAFVAIEAYSGAIALRPASMLAHLRRGEVYQRRGELEEAVRDFRTAAGLDPTAPRPLESLGDALYQMQRFERAAESYASALRLDDREPGVSYKLALARYRTGDIDAAVATLQSGLRLDSRRPEAFYLLGLCLRDAHRNAEAMQAFEQAVRLSPDLVVAREELGALYATVGRYADQIEQLQQIAIFERHDTARQVAIGLAQAHAGNEALAVSTLGKALRSSLDPTADQPILYQALGTVWLERAQASHDRVYLAKALEALGRGASGPAPSSAVLTLYGRALLLNGQVEAAEHAFKDASGRFPLEPAALALYATTAERLGHLSAARQALIDYSAVLTSDADAVSVRARIATLSTMLSTTLSSTTLHASHATSPALLALDHGVR